MPVTPRLLDAVSYDAVRFAEEKKERNKKKKGKIVKRRRRRIRGSISNLFLLSAVAIRPCPMAILSDYRTTIFEFRKGKRTRMDERTYSRRASGRLRFLVPRV